ncbi:MAG: sulfotransferase [Alphaproteobacteria bacterium]
MIGETLQAATDAWQRGDAAEAERLAGVALAQDPHDVAALRLAGAAASRRGDHAAAIAHFRLIADLQPGAAAARFNLAEALRKAGDSDAAVGQLDALLHSEPGHVPALVTLAMLLAAGPRRGEAMALLDRALAQAPNDPRARLARGRLRLAAGRADALDDLRAACRLDPVAAPAQLALGQALAAAGDPAGADAALLRALTLQPALPQAHVDRAKLAMLRHDPAAAEAHCRRALSYDHDHIEAHAVAAQSLQELRRPDEARRHAARALALDPCHAVARLTEAQLLAAEGATAEARMRLEALLADETDPAIAVEALTELGHALDRLGEYRAAFARFAESNRLQAGLMPQDPARRTWLGRRIAAMAALPAEAVQAPAPHADDRVPPVFVVGFPRSGTTLVEQVLAAQGGFVTSDEAPLIGRLARSLGEGYPASLADLGADAAARLRADYWQQAESRFPTLARGLRLVDKQPWNLIELPLVARLFPAAPVLLMVRDPRDACLSAFMQYFAPDPATVHLLTLADAAATYAAMADLWQRLAPDLPTPTLVLRYEDLVADFEATARRLLRFVGADWNAGVGDFAARAAARPISTPSRDAVSAPVSARAVGRWRNYAREIAPVLPMLAPYVRRYGYDDA